MKELLTRKECTAMKGLAILGIMLHNYCHWLKDIVRENEFTWQLSKCDKLFSLGSKQLVGYFTEFLVPSFAKTTDKGLL